jgi:hypothetical protein
MSAPEVNLERQCASFAETKATRVMEMVCGIINDIMIDHITHPRRLIY